MNVTTFNALKGAIYGSVSRKPDIPLANIPLQFPWLRATEVLLDAVTVFVCVETGFALWTPRWNQSNGVDMHQWRLIAFVSSWIMVILLDRSGAYRTSGGLLRLRETASVTRAVLLALLAVIPSLTLLQMTGLMPFAILASVFVLVGLILQKHLFHNLISTCRSKFDSHRRVLIYGAGASARMLYSAFARSPKLGFFPIALVDDVAREDIEEPKQSSGIITVLRTDFSATLLRQHSADMVVISSPFSAKEDLQHVIKESASAGAHVAFGTEFTPHRHSELEYIELDGQFVYGEHRVSTNWLYAFTSRGLDVLISLAMLILGAVPLLLVALAIRLESSGPIFFRQVRIGLDGIPFVILKCRTMYEESCEDKISPINSSDPRITRTGKWLRRTSLDELPQLLNVLRGDMALVGPRPEMPFIVAGYSDHQRKRLSVKPGLTGIWQISTDRRYPIHENLHYDLYYLKHRSLPMDIAVMLHTLIFAVRGS